MNTRKTLQSCALALGAIFTLLVVIPQSLAKTTVSEKDCVITITVTIQISGPGATDAIATKIKNEIESCYNGHGFKYDCCTVKFVAKVTNGGPNDPNAHQIKIVKDPKGKYVSNVKNPLPKPNGGSGSGTWSDNPAGQVYAHEAGHLMGLKDKYKEVGKKPRRTKPCKGHEKNKMATLSGKPTQADVNSIVKESGVKCPDKCKKGKASSSDSSSNKVADVSIPQTGETVFIAISPQANVTTTIQLPQALGGGSVLVGPFDGSLTLMADGPADGELNPFSDPHSAVLELLEFDFIGPPVELPGGQATGEVILSLNTTQDTHRSLGQINNETGEFDLYVNGTIKTDFAGTSFSFPFESIITGQFDQESGLADFQCETLITVLPESDVPPTDCDHDGIHDAKQIEAGLALDLNRDSIPDACQASREMRFYNGEAAGGSIEAKIGGYNDTCAVAIPTYAGESCELVMDRLASAINENGCLRAQGISAEKESGRLAVTGMSVFLEENILDSGIQRLSFGEPLVVGPEN